MGRAMQPRRPSEQTVRRRRIAVLCLAAVSVAAVLVVMAGGGGPGRRQTRTALAATGSKPGRSGPTTTAAAASSTSPSSTAASTAPATTPTTAPPTTVDPGLLPQTEVLPSATDPAFLARMEDLWQAITTGNPAPAQAAFFPLSAYIQVKGISDPVHDYQTRLIVDYDQDIETLHAELGAQASTAVLVGVHVPATAQWILPGVEYNKGSYYRVYSSSMTYSVAGVDHYFYIASMISWRGEWYVVHLNSIR